METFQVVQCSSYHIGTCKKAYRRSIDRNPPCMPQYFPSYQSEIGT